MKTVKAKAKETIVDMQEKKEMEVNKAKEKANQKVGDVEQKVAKTLELLAKKAAKALGHEQRKLQKQQVRPTYYIVSTLYLSIEI